MPGPLRRLRCIVLASAVVIALAACNADVPAAPGSPTPISEPGSSGPNPTESPAYAPSPTATEIPAPTSVPSGDPGLLFTGLAVRVLVAELNIRDDPTVESTRVATMQRGTIFWINGDEPLERDGYVWWWGSSLESGLPSLPQLPPRDGPTGYIAVRKGDIPYVEPIPARCPAIVDLRHVSAMLPFEPPACFGSDSLTLEGTFGCYVCGIIGPYRYEPDWLAGPTLDMIRVKAGGHLELHIPPGIVEPAPGDILRVRGHFDDPRSSECSITFLGPENPDFHTVDPAIAEAVCRTRFVVDDFQVIGSDPEFPTD